MPAITLVVTNAGRAALVDAATAGTFAVRIAEAGLTASAFTPLATATTLPGEFARIAGVSGSAIDPDTITLVIRDDSAAIYTLRGLGLFLDDGTLFAIYSQPSAILEKSANSTALIVLDVRFADIDATSLTFGDANFLNPPATTSVQGVIEIATDAEAIAGVDAVRAITPASLKALIDNRFGAAAASAFVRTLLTAATAAAFRLTLGLKSAALKDEGSGNGLDADTLDGHHLRVGANAVTWPGVAFVQADGVMEVGSRLDFHSINNDPADFTVSLGLTGGNFARSGNRLWDSGNDGAGSGLDADLLDGQDGSFYTNIAARLGFVPYNAASVPAGFGLAQNAIGVTAVDPDTYVVGSSYFSNHVNNGYGGAFPAYVVTLAGGDTVGRGLQLSAPSGSSDMLMRSRGADWTRMWTAGNDGAGSGLDADLLDGQQLRSGANSKTWPGVAFVQADGVMEVGVRLDFHDSNADPADYTLYLGMADGSFNRSGNRIWDAGNDGAGSGLDADLLDGRDSTSFADASHTHGAADLAPAFATKLHAATGFQLLPGGLMLQWGQVRGYSGAEGVGPYVPFPTAFAESPFALTATPINNSSSIVRDLAVQTTSRTVDGFNTFYQGEGAGGDQIDGFDWIAIGRA